MVTSCFFAYYIMFVIRKEQMEKEDFKRMVREYGLEHTIQRVNVEKVMDTDLRHLLFEYQKLCDEIKLHLEYAQSLFNEVQEI